MAVTFLLNYEILFRVFYKITISLSYHPIQPLSLFPIMGCKPSKQSQVATGNMVSSHNLQKKQSNVSKKETSEIVSNLNPIKAEEKGNLVENVEVKEAQLSVASEEERKLIAVDSPDRYFSSRKDEDIAEGVIASSEHLSEMKESEIKEEEVVTMVEGEVVEMDGDLPVDVDRDEKTEEEDKGETSSSGSVDVKETILVEEEGSEATTAE